MRHSVGYVALFVLALAMFTPLAHSAAAQPSLPPFSIYGTPAPPSSSPFLNRTGEYWGPYAKSIYVTWFTTTEAEIEALVNGYIQYDLGGVSTIQQYDQLLSYAQAGQIGLNATPYNGIWFIGFKYNAYPYNSTQFRLGIQQLENYQDIAAAFDDGILGVASPYYLYPGLYGQYFTSQQQQAYEKYGAFNTSAAVKDFEAAGLVDHSAQGYWSYPNGTKLVLPFYIWDLGVELDQALIAPLISNAASINLTINEVIVSFSTFVYDLLPGEDMGMYLAEFGFGPPAEPNWFWLLLSNSPLAEYYEHYDNQTTWNLINKLYFDSSSIALAKQYANAAAVYLQETVPFVTIGWATSLVPASAVGWSGNILQGGVGYVFPGNVHPANSTFGGLYRYGDIGPLADQNIYTEVTGPDEAILAIEWASGMQLSYDSSNLFPWAVSNWTISAGSGMMPNGHPYDGSTITLHLLHNAVWQDGTPLTAADLNFTLWYFDSGGFAANPYNPGVDTIDFAPGLTMNLTADTLSPSPTWFGNLPGMVGTYVPPSDPYTLTIYMNTTSVFSLYSAYPAIWEMPIMPEHAFYNVTEARYSTEPVQDYLSQQVMAGAYMFQSWSETANYATLIYFPSYFLANPYSYVITGSQGSTVDFGMNVTVYGDHVVQTAAGYSATFNKVDNGTGTVYILNNSTLSEVASAPLTSSGNGGYTAAIDTSSLAPGTYYLIGQVNWTGAPYYYYDGGSTTQHNSYSYHEYGVLVVTPKSTASSTPTSSSVAPSSSSATSTQTLQPTTTVSSSVLPVIYLSVVIIMVVIITALALVLRRRPTAKAST
jgi:ABC-type transport system substrate-binding protein